MTHDQQAKLSSSPHFLTDRLPPIIHGSLVLNQDSGSSPHRIHGVDLKAAECLVRRLLLHKVLVPSYSLTPSLPTHIPPALLELLKDPGQPFMNVIHPAVDPGWRAHEVSNSSGVPRERAMRKRLQIVAVLEAFTFLMTNTRARTSQLLIYDFCGGCGHIGIAVAAFFPEVHVLIVDRTEKALLIAESRYRTAGLSNIDTLRCNVEDLPTNRASFDIAIALHACGPASDAVLSQASRCFASVVIVPCCVGAVCNADLHKRPSILSECHNSPPKDVAHPARSSTFASALNSSDYALLARAADFGEENVLKRDQWRGVAKALVEHDRLLALREAGYDHTYLVKMRPLHCTPKNDILIAWRGTSSSTSKKDISDNDQANVPWPVDHISNGVFFDLVDASVLNGLGDEDVNAVEGALQKAVCAPGSVGYYESASGIGPRARKVIHAVAHSLALTHKSVGKGTDRRVVVKRNENWPLYFEHYVGIGGPFIDAIARDILASGIVPKAFADRREFVRGRAHHITLVGPKEISKLPLEMKTNRQDCLKNFNCALFGTSFDVVGVGKVQRRAKVTSETCLSISDFDPITEEAYFAIVEWPSAQTYRRKLGLPLANFHMTLGFRDKDIHDMAKDISTIVKPLELTCTPWLRS